MTKKPVSIDKDELAAKALSIMNNRKITSLVVFDKKPNISIELFTYIRFYNQIFLDEK